MDDSPFHHLGRMDWGFGNPNKTATLIAIIMTAVWVFSYVRKWGFWVALALFTSFGIGLILTQSRGGLVGALAGGLAVLAWTPRPFPRRRSLAVVIACVGLSFFAFMMKAESRYTQGLKGQDLSIANRLLIWEQVPAMIHDAPNGWGIGRSGDAYMQWYQPLHRGEGYRTLVNSHLTWLVELDWPGRIVYVFAWVAIFILLWPPPGCRWFSIPLGIWVCLAVCASFSSVAEARSLWIIPVLALMTVLVVRFRRKSWPKNDTWLGGAAVASVLVGLIWLSGLLAMNPSMVRCPSPGVVTLGTTSPQIWIVYPNQNVLGEHYGHEVRRGYANQPVFQQMGVGLARELKAVPKGQIVVFSGQIPSSLEAATPSHVILINPKPDSARNLQALFVQPNVTVIVGEYSQNKDFWNEQARSHPNLKVQLVAGAEDYISNWMTELSHTLKNEEKGVVEICIPNVP